jgi:hypothetical protein
MRKSVGESYQSDDLHVTAKRACGGGIQGGNRA